MGKTPAQEMARKLTATKKKMAEERKKTKCKEDPAFGLKNQKGAKQKLNVDRLKAQAAKAGRTNAQIIQDEKKKEQQRERARLKKLGWTEEELLLGKRVVAKAGMGKLAIGVDPKTVLCGYFKAGKCKQGHKCKFSHDLDIERKGKSKKSLYSDTKDREADTMDKWDQEKLESVIAQKKNNPNATQIVCNYFLEAVETKKYGWFWKCDNGEQCLYQHKLPPGFVLKSDISEEDKQDEVDICEQIEEERAKLDTSECTPVTPETFAAWKEKKKKEKMEEMKKLAEESTSKKGSKKKQHRSGLTGRALFTFRPNIFQDDLDAAGDEAYEYEEGEVVEEVKAKNWFSEVVEVDESDFLAALKLHEEGDEPENEEKGDAAAKEEAATPAAEAAAPVEAELTPEEIAKAAAAADRKAKREAKKAAKDAAKKAKNAKVLTAFEKKKLGIA